MYVHISKVQLHARCGGGLCRLTCSVTKAAYLVGIVEISKPLHHRSLIRERSEDEGVPRQLCGENISHLLRCSYSNRGYMDEVGWY